MRLIIKFLHRLQKVHDKMVIKRQDEISLNILDDKGFVWIIYRTLLLIKHTTYLEKI